VREKLLGRRTSRSPGVCGEKFLTLLIARVRLTGMAREAVAAALAAVDPWASCVDSPVVPIVAIAATVPIGGSRPTAFADLDQRTGELPAGRPGRPIELTGDARSRHAPGRSAVARRRSRMSSTTADLPPARSGRRRGGRRFAGRHRRLSTAADQLGSAPASIQSPFFDVAARARPQVREKPMAAGTKPTAVHFTLIFFVMLNLILGVVAYMFYTDFQEQSAQLATAQGEVNTSKQALANALAQIEDLKKAIGFEFTDIGTEGDQNPNTVLGALNQLYVTVGGVLATAPQRQTVREVVTALATAQQNRAAVAQTAQENEQSSRANFQTQTQQQTAAVTQSQEAQRTAEAQLRDRLTKFDEQLAALNQQVDQWQQQYRDANGKYETLREEYTTAQDDWAKERNQLQLTIDFQRDQIAQLQNISFESADGEIQYVDNTTRHVWINRGDLDYLRPQVTFSVYTKEHRGIARSIADVKAKIEVVEVGQRSAKCKILDDDISRPIAPGDPIYSPLWQSGLVEKFAFIGLVDLDGDGVSDRELLKEIMDANHARIKLQILDDGTREPAEATLDVDVKFLVEGEIPDPTQFAGQDEKQRHIEAIMAERRALMDDAKKYGVTVISLNEFLTYVGFRRQQQIYRPGQAQPYGLSAGARSTSTDQVAGDRTSTSPVSGAYQQNRTGGTSGGGSRFGGR